MTLRFKEPHVIRATYRIVTPMFIGDAQQKASGISPASVKGALRFWWRALNWGAVYKEAGESEAAALKLLHEQEGALFGTSAEKGRAAEFTLRVGSSDKQANLPTPAAGVQYLLGQGLFHHSQGFLRSAISEGETLSVSLIINGISSRRSQALHDRQTKQLSEALIAMGFLGGLGSRARKGFGSIAIQSLVDNDQAVSLPQNPKELSEWLSAFKLASEIPPFSALSASMRIDVSLVGKKPMEVLNTAGLEQQLYRSFGRNDNVNNVRAEKNFRDDHDLVADVIRTAESPDEIPRRSVFGLPHNYFYSSTKGKADFAPASKERSRRASPLFIHVHQFPDNQVALIQSLFPAIFLPENDRLEFKVNRKSLGINFSERMINWDVIHTYMDRFDGRERLL